MNQTDSQIQVSNLTNLSPPLITVYSDSRYDNTLAVSVQEQAPTNAVHVTSASRIIHSQTQELTYQPQRQTTPAQIFVHPSVFFYRPPNDFCHYYVSCKEICYDTVTHLLNKLKENNIQVNENECIFFHQQQYDNRFYQISCEIVSPSLIDNCLNKNFLGFELQQNMNQEYLTFTSDQKENLEYF
ncbi:hypothetical protein RclHR1_12640001 [Rhizophagus clarus]|uniref:Uncharacterized protein n=1 Tax=Rhizophagus clarus TaxID=94130 RepID=A0A2Z6QN69_9GLOM|nr:hypothetical protein RclHR1_12640001 [Rhizophagus clarus]GES73814.1 hypothetical protein GLOIN_2v1874599 [Rhizophagus clarus]